MRTGKIAILVPTRNAGALLGETVASVARAGLSPSLYEIIVSDNASDDGSTKALPAVDSAGAAIHLRRNATDAGRVANWNCAVTVAEEMGFSYAMFLMAGDLLEGDGLGVLRERMDRRGASLGIASYLIADEALRPKRIARRIHWQGDPDAAVESTAFLAQSLGTGAMLCGPLGANLYRIDGRARLRFDPDDPSHTDQLATALFVREANDGVVYLHRPISIWRHRPGRFHSSMKVEDRLQGDLRVVNAACQSPDFAKIRASLTLRGTIYNRGNLPAAWVQARELTGGASLSWPWLADLMGCQVRYRTPWSVVLS